MLYACGTTATLVGGVFTSWKEVVIAQIQDKQLLDFCCPALVLGDLPIWEKPGVC